jgi:uncharacterized protein YhbP (UPF0306 family)
MSKDSQQAHLKITAFINRHHVLTLATTVEDMPWCAHCFYVFDEEARSFYVLSDEKTMHVQQVTQNNNVAGAIVLESRTVGKLQGLQFTGTMYECTGKALSHAKKMYVKSFPYAILTNTTVWAIHMKYAKYTDNRLGFGTKLIWE